MRSRNPHLVLSCLLALGVASGAAAAKPEPVPQALTSGTSYDRNPTYLEDGSKDRLVFFARTQTPCNRLLGCNADSARYDLWALHSGDRGRTWSAPELVAVNPGNPAFYGRTTAAVRLDDGTIHVFWASGGNGNTLYVLTRQPGSDTWDLSSNVDDFYFNVEAVTDGESVIVYYDDEVGDVYVRTFDGTTFGPSQLIFPMRSIPKVLRAKGGDFRMTMVDPAAWPSVDVLVASSEDGFAWSGDQVAVASQGGVANWDPVLSQDKKTWTLHFAPDLNDGRQRIERSTSTDFETWSEPEVVTAGTDGTTSYWEYWPEPGDSRAGLFYTSEAPSGATPAGVGHVWVIPGR